MASIGVARVGAARHCPVRYSQFVFESRTPQGGIADPCRPV